MSLKKLNRSSSSALSTRTKAHGVRLHLSQLIFYHSTIRGEECTRISNHEYPAYAIINLLLFFLKLLLTEVIAKVDINYTPPKSPAGGLQKNQCLTSPPAGDLGGVSRLLQLPQL